MATQAFTPAQLASNIAFQTAKKAKPSVSTTPAPLQSLLKPKSQQSQAISTNNIWWIPWMGLQQVNNPIQFTPQTPIKQPTTPKELPKTGADLWTLSENEINFARAAFSKGFSKDEVYAKIQSSRNKPSESEPIIPTIWAAVGEYVWSFGTLWKQAWIAVWQKFREWAGKDRLTPEQIQGLEQGKWAKLVQWITEWATPEQKATTTYQIAKPIVDVAATATTLPKLASVGWLVGKIGQYGTQWVLDYLWYSLLWEKKIPTAQELWVAWVTNIALWWLWKLLQIAGRSLKENLQLAWLINPKDLTDAAKALKTEKEIWKVWQWTLDKGIVGSKETMINKLDNFATANYDKTQGVLAKSQSLHKVPEAEWALTKLKNAFWWKSPEAWLEDLYNEVNVLLQKSKTKWLSLLELNKVQKLQWEYLTNFVKAWTDVKETLSAKANANLYNKVKTFIEDKASAEWLWDVKTLKKDTQIAYMLKNAITKKEAADYARQLLSPFGWWAIWAGIWIMSWQDPMTIVKNWLVWLWLWAMANNKFVTSYIAHTINKLWSAKATPVIADFLQRFLSIWAGKLTKPQQ